MSSGGTPSQEREETRGGIGAILRLRVELWVVIVFMALAFGAGILVTAMYEEPQPVAGFQQTGQVPVAPPLTDQDLQGPLPSGHPDIDGPTGGEGITGPTGQAAQGDPPSTGGGT